MVDDPRKGRTIQSPSALRSCTSVLARSGGVAGRATRLRGMRPVYGRARMRRGALLGQTQNWRMEPERSAKAVTASANVMTLMA